MAISASIALLFGQCDAHCFSSWYDDTHRSYLSYLRYVSAEYDILIKIAWTVYWSHASKGRDRRRAYFRHMRSRHLNLNSQNILTCVHNPLLDRPSRPELASAHATLCESINDQSSHSFS